MRCAAPGNVPASAESAAKEAVPTRPLSNAGVQHAKPSTSASTHATAAGPAQVHIRYAGAPAVGVGTHAAPSVNPESADDAYRGAALGARVRGRRSKGMRRFDSSHAPAMSARRRRHQMQAGSYWLGTEDRPNASGHARGPVTPCPIAGAMPSSTRMPRPCARHPLVRDEATEPRPRPAPGPCQVSGSNCHMPSARITS